jgi:PhnB protein
MARRTGALACHSWAFWGARTGQFIDPFGHRWALDQHLRDVPHAEVVRLAAEAFSGG